MNLEVAYCEGLIGQPLPLSVHIPWLLLELPPVLGSVTRGGVALVKTLTFNRRPRFNYALNCSSIFTYFWKQFLKIAWKCLNFKTLWVKRNFWASFRNCFKKYGRIELQWREISTGCLFFRCVEAIRQIFRDNFWCLDLSKKTSFPPAGKSFSWARAKYSLFELFILVSFWWIPSVLMICMHEWFLLVR